MILNRHSRDLLPRVIQRIVRFDSAAISEIRRLETQTPTTLTMTYVVVLFEQERPPIA